MQAAQHMLGTFGMVVLDKLHIRASRLGESAGVEALEKALNTSYDLYLVDVNMPILDGYSFIRELRSHADIAQAPAVMVSTEAKPSDQEKAIEVGANLYIVKPARPDHLLSYVRLLLGESSA
jgi:two-component system chemotaxis response regulator CheY